MHIHPYMIECSTKKWKEADAYIDDILDVYKHMRAVM